MKIIISIFLLFFISCSIFNNTKHTETYNFKGKTLGKVQNFFRVNITQPLKSELTLMTKDSTIISKFITDDNGNFNEKISINTKWNPLIIKIRGLENIRIDTIPNPKKAIIGYSLACSITKPLFRNIAITSDTLIILKFECRSSETADPGGDEY